MYAVPQPAAPERPASLTQAAVSVGVTCVGMLLVTFAAVAMMTWQPPDGTSAGTETEGMVPTLVIEIGWNVLAVVLLMMGVVMALRGVNGGRIMVYVVSSVSLLLFFGCGGLSLLAETVVRASESDSETSWPPHWMFWLAAAGSLLGIAATIAAFVFLGKRSTREYLKPQLAVPYPPQQQYPGYGPPSW